MSWRNQSKEMTEAEIVERARKNLQHVARWGRWWAGFHWSIAIAYAVMFAWVCNLALGWGANLAQNRADLWLGFFFGVFGGALLYGVGYGVVEGTLSGLPDQRNRLLVHYHDALIEIIGDTTDVPLSENIEHAG